ncbi:hypothetical protein ACWD6N_03680 [Micromonospora sp. NPDC005163]
MSLIRDLLVGAAFLAPIGVGVGLLAAFGRDRTADEHDLSDYHAEPTAELEPRRHTPDIRPTVTVDAPETARTDGPTPPLARALLIDHAVPTLSEAAISATADDWLREIAAEQQAKAGIVRVVSPATDRDLTGAFAVVRAA